MCCSLSVHGSAVGATSNSVLKTLFLSLSPFEEGGEKRHSAHISLPSGACCICIPVKVIYIYIHVQHGIILVELNRSLVVFIAFSESVKKEQSSTGDVFVEQQRKRKKKRRKKKVSDILL